MKRSTMLLGATAALFLTLTPFASAMQPHGLTGQYFSNSHFTNPFGTRVDANLDFPEHFSGMPGIDDGDWSAIWDGTIVIPSTDTWGFCTNSDDGSWVYIDGNLVVNNGGDHGAQWACGSASLTAGSHLIEVRYTETFGGGANLQLDWYSSSMSFGVVPSSAFSPSAPGFPTPELGPIALVGAGAVVLGVAFVAGRK